MKLPGAISRLLKDDKNSHTILLLLAGVNLFLLIVIFILFGQANHFLPKFITLSADTPVIRFNIISPQEGATISGTVPLVATLSNGPQITKAKLTINGKDIQTVFSQETEKLTVYWDTKKFDNGKYQVTITAYDSEGGVSTLYTGFTVENNSEEPQKPPR